MLLSAIIIVIMIIILASEKLDPIKTLIATISVFMIMGYISIEEITTGLTNEGILSIAALFILIGAIERSPLFRRLTEGKSLKENQASPRKFVMLAGLFSLFIYNAPIVAIFIPLIKKVSISAKQSASKYYLPLSFIALLGGTLTLIGSSTNLIASGVIESIGYEPIAFWELTLLSLPSVIIGVIYIFLFNQKVLPDNAKEMKISRANISNHLVRFVVSNKSDIINKNIRDANLRHLEGVYLVEIEREGKALRINYEMTIQANDILIFTGERTKIDDLRNIQGLVLESDYQMDTNYFNSDETVLMEVIVTQNVENMTIKEMKFRNKNQAIVLGVIRNGVNLKGKIGNIIPKLGDTLLLIVDRQSQKMIEENFNYTVLNKNSRVKSLVTWKSYMPFIVLLFTILSSAIFSVSILTASLISIGLLFILDVITLNDAIKFINFKTIMLLVLSLSIGVILANTGLIEVLSESIAPVIMNLNPFLIYLSIFALMAMFTLVISNNAVVVFMLPVIASILMSSSYDIRSFLLVVTIAASASYLSPFSYQTNTMVYGAGGYKYIDFIKFGLPLLIIVALATSLTAMLLFH